MYLYEVPETILVGVLNAYTKSDHWPMWIGGFFPIVE